MHVSRLVMRQGDGHSCSGALHSTLFPVKREHQAILIAGICKFIDSETERLKNWIIQRAANKCIYVWRYYMQVWLHMVALRYREVGKQTRRTALPIEENVRQEQSGIRD